ncbi:hypothetical protein C8P68_1076 [Mucilaginibacter yixingensis]|uniref:Type I restriction and modification enzyme subunit R-like protein n=1 Tax=Mucilaginibacter yixingensis TaxID=1295612 RepID=A0A2T5J629_9SPHI|nr:hypothetical protein [Mucilaginibacter yixingensis]PTQ93949.1 hypothetical protein C8P68_1076 [Mucilaginibacter yixingensis]
MNEHEFQTYVAQIIGQLFPTLQEGQIEQEHAFSLKFGHHAVVIDGKEPGKYAKSAIYDILLKFQGKPFALLELKKPGNGIEPEDIRQGVSYARLTQPICPLTILTDGTTTQLINTFDGEPFKEEAMDIQFIENLFRQGLLLSANSLKNAISTLLEADHRVIFDVINTISHNAFEQLRGDPEDISKPIMRDFKVARSAERKIWDQLEKTPGVFLTGEPFVGKTNLLYQLFETAKNAGQALLYINAADQNYNIFRRLSNFITMRMRYPVTEERVKEWLLLSSNRSPQDRLVVVYDHFRHDTDEHLKADIAELFDVFEADNNRVILATDNANYDLLTTTAGRTTTNFYRERFARIRLKTFSSKEFELANQLLYDRYGGMVLPGGIFAGEYRNPRVWRLIAKAIRAERTQATALGIIEAVPSFQFLQLISNHWHFDAQTRQDFKALSVAFMESMPLRNEQGDLKLMALNLPVIAEQELKKHLENEVIERLKLAGLLERRLLPDDRWVFLPKLPELIAKNAGEHLKARFQPLLLADFHQHYPEFLEAYQYLPFGEIIAAQTIVHWGYQQELDLFSAFIRKLQSDKPEIETATGGGLVRLYLPEKGHITLPIEPGEEQKYIGNLFPYLILSHLVTLQFVDDSQHPDMERARCIAAVGQTNFQVRSLNVNTFYEPMPTNHEVGNIGNITHSGIGIVEPIVQAMQANIIQSPQVIDILFRHALEKKYYRLLHRIYIAARYSDGLGSPESDALCESIQARYMDHFNKMMAFAIADKGATRSERRKIEKGLRKRDRKQKK